VITIFLQESDKMESLEKMCLNCAYFNNAPEYIEAEIKGLTTLGSGYASIRKDDGICSMTDRYLSAMEGCSNFKSRTGIIP